MVQETKVIGQIEKKINACLIDCNKHLRKQDFGTIEFHKERGERLGYVTSLECCKRVRESLEHAEADEVEK